MQYIVVILLCVGVNGFDNSQKTMKIAGLLGMTTSDYVFLLPWVVQALKNREPWISNDNKHVVAKEEFRSVLIVSILTAFFIYVRATWQH